MVSPVKLAHIVFWTDQIEAMTDWYAAVLDARVVFAGACLVFLTYDEEHHRVALIRGGGERDEREKPAIGFYHAAFTYDTLLDLLDTGDRLKAAGILPWRTINHGPTISYYYRDPDGNSIELQVDRFEDPDDATAYMQGEAFQRNSVGCLIDPEDLRAKILAGVPLADVMKRIDD